MSLLWADPGGEYYFSLGIAGALTAGALNDNSNSSLVSNAAAGRLTTYAISHSGSGNYFAKFFGNFQTLIAGWANYNSSSVWVNGNRIIAFVDSATTQVDVRTDASGHLFATRNGTTIGSASSGTLTTGWHYYEVKAHIASGTSGSVEVRVDGVVFLTVTGVNTQATGNAFANRVYWLPLVQSTQQYYKDLYVLDTGTGINTTYLGDIAVAVIWPNSAGTNQQWTPNTGTQVAAVQDGIAHTGTWPDGDTTYIGDGTSGHISDFGHQAVTVTGTIFGAIHASYARKDVAGSQSINQVALQSGSVVETGATISLGNAYLYYFDVLEQDPTGPATWTDTTFNATAFGVKVT
jgi:hypothetical protein